jgi:tape measure domain-containing protein
MPVDTIITRFVQQGVGGLRADLLSVARDAGTTEGALDRLSRRGDRVLGFGTAAAAGLGLAASASLKASGEIAMAEIGFSKALGSMEAARAQIEELKEFDRASPFSFTESVKGAQRLLAVGFAGDKLKETLTDIGDAAAGTGGSTDDFMGIGRAIGQMRNKGKVSMEEINQLADRNIPALQILQKQLKLTDDEMSKLMAGDMTISADKAIPAILKGFHELYGGSMAEAAKTFPGQVSNLQSAVTQLGAAIGDVISEDSGNMLARLTGMADATAEWVKANPELARMGINIAAIATAGALAYGTWLKLSTAWNIAKLAKRGLEAATKADTVAETAKAVVAGTESKAITGVGTAATHTAGKLGVLARARAFLTSPGGKIGGALLGAYVVGKTTEAVLNHTVNEPMEERAEGKLRPFTPMERSTEGLFGRDLEHESRGNVARFGSERLFRRLYEKDRRERQAAEAWAVQMTPPPMPNGGYNPEYQRDPTIGGITNQRNGETQMMIRIPEREADRSHRKLRYNNRTAAPSYGG